MAERAETLNFESTRSAWAPVVPLPSRKTQSQKPILIAELRRFVVERYRAAEARAARCGSLLFDKSRDLKARVENKILATREQNPLLIVGLVAGTAFVLGAALRIWRSEAK